MYGAGRRRAGQHEDRQYDDRSGDRAESGHGASCTWRTGFRGGSISLEDHKSPRSCGTLAVLAQKKLREARPIVRVGSYSRRCDPPARPWSISPRTWSSYDAISSYTLGSGVHRRARVVQRHAAGRPRGVPLHAHPRCHGWLQRQHQRSVRRGAHGYRRPDVRRRPPIEILRG